MGLSAFKAKGIAIENLTKALVKLQNLGVPAGIIIPKYQEPTKRLASPKIVGLEILDTIPSHCLKSFLEDFEVRG